MIAIDRFSAALAIRPIRLDAAMGTRLIARELDLAQVDPAAWTLDRPDEVLRIHRADVEAGSDAVLTNTFGANRAWLARSGLADRAVAINRGAVELARLAVGPSGFVIGSIGPTASDHPDALREQAEALVEAGADAILLETHRIDQAERALRQLAGGPVPILASLHDWPEPVNPAAGTLVELGAAAIGANCLPGIVPTLAIARKLRGIGAIPLLMKPAAGWPGSVPETPGAFAAAWPELRDLGVRLIGGCCGTTEAHIAALRSAMDPGRP